MAEHTPKEALDLVERGAKAFRKREYVKAISLFTRAIRIANNPSFYLPLARSLILRAEDLAKEDKISRARLRIQAALVLFRKFLRWDGAPEDEREAVEAEKDAAEHRLADLE